MRSYNGIIRIACAADQCDEAPTGDVQAGCLNCVAAELTIVDHAGSILAGRTGPIPTSESDNPQPINEATSSNNIEEV